MGAVQRRGGSARGPKGGSEEGPHLEGRATGLRDWRPGSPRGTDRAFGRRKQEEAVWGQREEGLSHSGHTEWLLWGALGQGLVTDELEPSPRGGG